MQMPIEQPSRIEEIVRSDIGRAMIGLCGLGAIALMSLAHALVL